MNNTYIASSSYKTFYCPHCDVCSNHVWQDILFSSRHTPPYKNDNSGENSLELTDYSIKNPLANEIKPIISNISDPRGVRIHNSYASICDACGEVSFWLGNKLLYPEYNLPILPNEDLEEHIISIFNEARAIFSKSPKGSAALLRLCIQHICIQLGENGKKIDSDIQSLVSKGLPKQIQQSLDIVRVVGNEAVHPGVIDLSDNKEMALALFELVNYIADEMITRPKKIDELYNKLPKNKLDGIKNRDKV
ncbi:DUF4145 domain-containing protein [Yersinia enterocolitica]|nr:DUF4145 domain-containing protein [Yersinia enterocolitica]EKN5986114.1 DUF4145 domain-containing protein [Yersinia enterocolitica]EKN5990512.1 DUF4145 domain-containing protein [Yersinia enterocolitica]ELX2243594.1 DUF4145 domain-containing protein [Yersinia enterocolitica]HDL6715822.1 DUF4145 domain-containing protein [Yersinia enterocolitica]